MSAPQLDDRIGLWVVRLERENADRAREVTRWRAEAWRTAEAAAGWIARNVIANEMHIDRDEPLPAVLRPHIARVMVADDFLGWPDVETAEAELEEEWLWCES